jgi:hypothetical protein
MKDERPFPEEATVNSLRLRGGTMHEIKFRIRRVAATLIAAGAPLLGANSGQAQNSYPDRPVRLIVPFPPGGQTDNVSRRLSVVIAPILGQQLIVDTRGGAAGTLGSGEVARAKADGYTLLIATTSTHALSRRRWPVFPTIPSKFRADQVSAGPDLDFCASERAAHPHSWSPSRRIRANIRRSSGVASINHLAGSCPRCVRASSKSCVPYKGVFLHELGGQIP